MAEEEVLHYYKLNVGHSVSVRFFRGDRDGKVINPTDPIVEIKDKDLKVFKEVNKYAILEGLIKEVGEPEESWETYNALDDADIAELLKSQNALKFKKTVENVTSLAILYKILEAATEKGASKSKIALITSRLDEIKPEESATVERGEMVSSYDEGVVARR